MGERDGPWNELAARCVRVALTRKGVSYAELSLGLKPLGVDEAERTLTSRVSRGRIKLPFFLQILTVVGSTIPPLWLSAIAAESSWDAKAKAIIEVELHRHPGVSADNIAARMVDLGADLTVPTLTMHLQGGTISLPDFLSMLVSLGSQSLDLYVDYSDLLSVASVASRTSRT